MHPPHFRLQLATRHHVQLKFGWRLAPAPFGVGAELVFH
jgi:hypothetical protein